MRNLVLVSLILSILICKDNKFEERYRLDSIAIADGQEDILLLSTSSLDSITNLENNDLNFKKTFLTDSIFQEKDSLNRR